MKLSYPGVLLPDVPGLVHGIKSTKPAIVQCDDCFTCWEALTIGEIASKVTFNGDATLRLCAACWLKRGWDARESRWAS